MLPESILQCFRPSLSYHLSLRPLFFLFLSGRLKQVLLYFDGISPARCSPFWSRVTQRQLSLLYHVVKSNNECLQDLINRQLACNRQLWQFAELFLCDWTHLSHGMWFPTMWHFDKYRLRRACAASFKLRNSKLCSVSSLSIIEYSSD